MAPTSMCFSCQNLQNMVTNEHSNISSSRVKTNSLLCCRVPEELPLVYGEGNEHKHKEGHNCREEYSCPAKLR